jgi:hypothetical protein
MRDRDMRMDGPRPEDVHNRLNVVVNRRRDVVLSIVSNVDQAWA